RLLLKPQALLFVVGVAMLRLLLMPCLRPHPQPSCVRFFPSDSLSASEAKETPQKNPEKRS
ncbi:MAG: hypothetical protein CL920_16870, partial [Deltaproteobacteria bacterium]|nr:hypothetical protein [Deltaproteobacteria bacterium]